MQRFVVSAVDQPLFRAGAGCTEQTAAAIGEEIHLAGDLAGLCVHGVDDHELEVAAVDQLPGLGEAGRLCQLKRRRLTIEVELVAEEDRFENDCLGPRRRPWLLPVAAIANRLADLSAER